MKKFVSFILICVVLFGAFTVAKKVIHKIHFDNYMKEVKEGWYVEVLIDELNIREEATQFSNAIGVAKKGELYKVLDYEVGNDNKYWFHIELYNKGKGWVANPKTGSKNLEDHNGTIDVATPTVSFKDAVYHVISIKDINYDHLKLWDDREDYKVTHQVYHEVDESQNIDQYWIKYTITDASGKSSSKTQKIVFEQKPSEDEVLDFSEHTRD